ncbi:hypothetical protein [Priestia megaterium]|uniref:hypothetical protein n=1 Tax=Priestia megaterium TaxID=1404 RepID=UPI000BFE3A1B|nr:hypothetical protein [Priestia megaterium]PGT75538.1 hypothetical protein COD15_07290 [Priestia megaterium]
MLNDLFYGMRDTRNKYKEIAVTTNRVGETIELLTDRQCNVRIDVEGLEGDTTLSIKFENSRDGATWTEIGTFPVPDPHHGVLFAKFQPKVRYTLIVEGSSPSLDVSIQF